MSGLGTIGYGHVIGVRGDQAPAPTGGTALWRPDLRTDPDGLVILKPRLPRRAATWHVVVHAQAAGGALGYATRTFRVDAMQR